MTAAPDTLPLSREALAVRADTITDRAALAAVTAAVDHGRSLGCRMNAAVVDAGGTLLAFLRATGAFLPSVGIATDKAHTAVAFGMPTEDLRRAVAEPPELSAGIAGRPGVVLIGGGLPIVLDGRVIGGIGCSGGSEAQDTACALAGLRALGLG